MMKNIIKTVVMSAVVALAMTSCSDTDPAGLTRITYYPVFTLEGGSIYSVPVGSSYADPGYKAVEGTEDVTAKVVTAITDIDGNPVDAITTTEPTFFTVTYSAVNVDGFEASAQRTVFVYDPSVTVSMEGIYSTDMANSMYLYKGTPTPFATMTKSYGYTDQCTDLEFTELAPGIYEVNDLMGGWYEQIRGFGANYGAGMGSMTGYVSLDGDNKISLMSSYIEAWGDGLDWIKNGVYDPATGVMSYDLSYAGSVNMTVVLNKD
jgi:hypothetical protein